MYCGAPGLVTPQNASYSRVWGGSVRCFFDWSVGRVAGEVQAQPPKTRGILPNVAHGVWRHKMALTYSTLRPAEEKKMALAGGAASLTLWE